MRLTLALALIAAPAVIWVAIVRPRLKARLVDLYADAGGLWARVRARLYAFRTLVLFAGGMIVAAAPELLAVAAGIDFSFLPQPWPGYVGLALALAQAVLRAYATTPGEEPPK